MPSSPPSPNNCGLDRILLELSAEYLSRKKDGLALYRPLPAAAHMHECGVKNRLVCGSNRAGKTLAMAAEIARIARGLDPYNKRAKSGLLIGCVGKNETHLADPMWRKLWLPGAFPIIADRETGLWRAVRPNPNDATEVDHDDMARESEWRPAPPLIPDHCIHQIAWHKKNQQIPKRVELTNGTVMLFSPSGGQPWQGIDLDVFWVDEELENARWVPEGQARLLHRNGLFIASFTPQAATPEFFDMHKKVLSGEPSYREFELFLEDNPYIPKQAKREFYDQIKHDPDALAIRYYGQWAILSRRVYPEYDTSVHTIEPPAGGIGHDWMRILFLDPGTTACHVAFAAVPPPHLPEGASEAQQPTEVHIYDEIYLKNSDARAMAEAIAKRTDGQVFYDFLIDQKAGQQKSMGRDNRVADHYAEEFERAGLRSTSSGHHFHYSSPNVEAREISLKHMLKEKTLKIWRNCRIVDDHIKNRYYDKNSRSHNPKREVRRAHDGCDNAEYVAAYFDRGVFWVNPEPPQQPQGDSVYELNERWKRMGISGIVRPKS